MHSATSGGGQPPIVINNKTSTLPGAIVALAVIALLGIVLVLGGFVLIAVLATPSVSAGAGGMESTFVAGDRGAKAKCVLIRLHGVILEQDDASPFAAAHNPVKAVRKRLKRAVSEKAKAIILEVNSPGGGITASELIHADIVKFKKEHPEIPVVVQMKDLAASGGYYVSAPADWIVAMPTSLTASIGVILMHQNLSGLLNGKLGIMHQAFKSGQHKDILSPFRNTTEEECKQLQAIVDEMFDRFVIVVTEGRAGKITEEGVRGLEGTILTGRQALEKGLVDQLGGLDTAIAKAKELAKVEELRVVRFDDPKTMMETLLGATFNARVQVGPDLGLGRHLARGGSPFLYLWRP